MLKSIPTPNSPVILDCFRVVFFVVPYLFLLCMLVLPLVVDISKSILLNFILNFAILSVFNVRNKII